jgi:hypothetical protein
MKFQKQLNQLVSCDRTINNLPQIKIHSLSKDRNHFSRRLQQRAINWDMVKLAIAYGRLEHFSQAYTWTLLDRNLLHTPYAKFIDKLRGLRIIATRHSDDCTIRLSTAYWAYSLRK